MNIKFYSVLAVVGALAACGDSGSSSSGGGGDEGGSGGNGNGGDITNGGNGNGGENVGAGTLGGGGAGPDEPACHYGDEVDTWNNYSATITSAEAGQGLCTPEQVTAWTTACFGADATNETCTAFTDANGPCDACLNGISGEEPTGIAPVYLPADAEGNAYPNDFACRALAEDLPECAVPVQNWVGCIRWVCAGCEDQATFTECVNYAVDSGECPDTDVPADCNPIFEQDPVPTQCDGADFVETVTNISNYFCGPAAL